MELIIDMGNSRSKVALFINNGIHKKWTLDELGPEHIKEIKQFGANQAIISSVKPQKEINPLWFSLAENMLWLAENTKLPFKNNYQTPKTLGKDRLAAVAGAQVLVPNENVLCIDAGTCITYDLLTKDGLYQGGNINLGLSMRFQALKKFTASLPLVEIPKEIPDDLIGKDTVGAILSGVINGFRAEVNGVINRYDDQYVDLQVILCGGDAKYLVNHFENKIFANQNLVLIGLQKILKYNL